MNRLLLLLIVHFISLDAWGYETFNVDWSPNRPTGLHILRITIDGCVTEFKVKDKDFYKFTESDDALTNAVEIAEKRAENGCN